MNDSEGEDRPAIYVLVCRDCDEDDPIPFGSMQERGEWAAAHTKATGHDRWAVLDARAQTHE